MKHIASILILCFCCTLLGACAGLSGGSATGSSEVDLPLSLPLAQNSTVFIQTENTFDIDLDLDGLVLALLQSEYGVRLADSARDADYSIVLIVESFEQTDVTDVPIDVKETALLGLAGVATGAGVGSSINGGEGAAWGAGIGALAGIGIGLLHNAGQERFLWEMVVTVDIRDPEGETHVREVFAEVEDQGMMQGDAIIALEDEVAWAVVDMFEY